MTRIRDVCLWALAKLIVAGMFQDLEIDRSAAQTRPHLFRSDGPRLVVANHPNGFVDVVVLVVAYGRYPRFVAKADLFRRWPLRWLLRSLGAIPIYQAGEGTNESSFREVHRALAKGHTIAVFPEGTVSSDEQLHPIRTGAARMMLGALANGSTAIEIIPVGLTYVDKVALRTRALARIGDPVLLDTIIEDITDGHAPVETDRSAVRRLTDVIRSDLELLSPDFGSLDREARLIQVADLMLRTDLAEAYDDPRISDTIDLARRIGRLPEDVEDEILDRAGRYHLELAATELRDDQIAPPARLGELLRSFVVTAVKLTIVLPLAVIGLATNVIPVILVMVAGSAIREPVTKGTARILTALVSFPAAWAFAVWTSGRTGWQLTLWVAILAAGSVLLVIAVSTMIEAVNAGISWRKVRSRRALVDRVLEVRADTVSYVNSVL